MKSLSARLIAIMLAVCIISMGLITAISTVLFRHSLLEVSFDKITQNTAKEAARISGWLENQAAYVTAIALELSISYQDGDTAERFTPHALKNSQLFDVYMGLPDGTALFNTGFIPDYDDGWRSYDRPWYKGALANTGQSYITEPYTDSEVGDLCITASMAIMRSGELVGVAAADVLLDVLSEIVLQTDVGPGSHAFMTDADGNMLIHPNAAYAADNEGEFQSLKTIEGGAYADLWSAISRSGETVKYRDATGTYKYYTAQTIEVTGWRLFTVIPVSVVEEPVLNMLGIFAIAFVPVLLAAVILIFLSVRRLVVRPIAQITLAADRLAMGSTDMDIQYKRQDEIGKLVEAFSHTAESIREQVQVTEVMAGGDLTAIIPVRSEQDVMGHALKRLQNSLTDFVGSISGASHRVSGGSHHIDKGAQALAQGSTEQASAVEELSSSINQVSGSIQNAAKAARDAAQKADGIRLKAEQGSAQMSHMLSAVQEINEASQGIGKVISVIDSIAFQTNILALNAAVEAARAGQHGRGFAIVAEEVRSLAAKSADAAQETGVLIQNSIQKAELGAKMAAETSASLQEIVSGIHETSTIVNHIAVSSEEQATAIRQINTGIDQVAKVVQLNSATAEESAAAAAELSQESIDLAEQVARFKVADAQPPNQQRLRLDKW